MVTLLDFFSAINRVVVYLFVVCFALLSQNTLFAEDTVQSNHKQTTQLEKLNDLVISNPDSVLKLVHHFISSSKSKQTNKKGNIFILLAKAHFEINQYDSAFYYAQKFRNEINEYSGINKLLAESYYIIGSSFYKLREIDSSKIYLSKSINLAENLSSDSLLAIGYKQLGNVLLLSGALEQAYNNYTLALQSELKREKPDAKNLSGIFQNLGIIFANTGQTDSSAFYFKKSLSLKETFLGDNDPNLGVGYLNMSYFLFSQGDVVEALDYINRAEEIYHNTYGKDYPELAPIYLNKGAILLGLYNYDESLVYHELALNLYKTQFPEEKNQVFQNIYSNLGLLYEGKEDFTSAVTYLELSQQLSNDEKQQVKDYRILGRCYLQLNEMQLAKKYLELSIEKAKVVYGVGHQQYAVSLLNYANYYTAIEDFEGAEKYLLQALDVFRGFYGEKNRDVSNVLVNLGNIAEQTKAYNKALQYYQKALTAAVPSYSDTSIFSNPGLDDIPVDLNHFLLLRSKIRSLLLNLKNYKNQQSVLEFCLETTELAVKFLSKVTSGFDQDKTKLLISEWTEDIFDYGMYFSYELFQLTGDEKFIEHGFEFTEKSKAAVLLEGIRDSEALDFSGLPKDLVNSENSINKEISNYTNLIYNEESKIQPDSSLLSKWKTSLFVKRQQYDSLIQILETKYPSYFDLKYNTEVIGLRKTIRALSSKDALIEYNLSDTNMYVFVVTKDFTKMVKVTIDSLFYQDVESFIGHMNTFPEVENANSNLQTFAQLGEGLFKKLFVEYVELSNYENLFVVPDDLLGYLSFEALIKSYTPGKANNYRNLKYLLRDHAFSYGYSATMMFDNKKRTMANNRVLAMAPDYKKLKKRDTSGQTTTERSLNEMIIPLAHTLSEVQSIGSVYDALLLTDSAATESNFKQAVSGFGILHFAMHTHIDDEQPLFSKMVFAADTSHGEDGFLNLYEIYNLDLNAQLAVLSACETGAGRLNRGEGIMSMARGFLYAGVPGIVMSLWPIEDIASSKIIVGFYENLKKGMSKNVALKQSKLSYLDNANQLESHPYYWAAFVQIGDDSPLAGRKYSLWYWIIGSTLLIAGLLLFVSRKRWGKK